MTTDQDRYLILMEELASKYKDKPELVASVMASASNKIVEDGDYAGACSAITNFMNNNPPTVTIPSGDSSDGDGSTPSGDSSDGDGSTPSGDSSDGDGTDAKPSGEQPLTQDYKEWGCKFNGNSTIYYNERDTEEALTNILNKKNDIDTALSAVDNIDKFFDGVVHPYNKLVPNPRLNYPDLYARLNASYDNCIQSVREIASAIKDYADGGDIDPKSTATLNKWIYGYTPGGGGGDGGGGAGDPGFDDDELDSDGLDSDGLDSSEPGTGDQVVDTPVLGEDEKLVIPGSGGSALSGSALGGIAGATSLDDVSNLDDDDVLSEELGDSLFSNSKFFIPSPNTTITSTDGIKGAGVIGGAGAVIAAASLALGGKIYYDKKHGEEDDENGNDNGEEDNTSLEIDEESKEDVFTEDTQENDEIDFDVSGVRFKESLLNDSEVD